MGVRLRTTVKSYGLPNNASREYRVNIYDSAWSSTITTFDCEALEFIHAGQEDDIFDPIATSTCRIDMLVNNATLHTFVQTLINADEGRFQVEVLYLTAPSTYSLYWRGLLQPELVSVDMMPTDMGYTFSLTATDGLARLKTVDYDDNGTPYEGRDQLRFQIAKALGKTGIADMYGASDNYFAVIHSWFANEMQISVTATFFAATRWHHRTWRKVDREGTVTPRSTYDVLAAICTAFGMKLRQRFGVYTFIEIGQYSNTGSVRLRSFDKSGNLSGFITSLNNWTGNIALTGTPAEFAAGTKQVMTAAGAEETYYPALRKTEVVYKHYSTQNLIAGAGWSNSLVSDVVIDDVDNNAGAVRIALSFGLSTRIQDTSVTDYTQTTPIWLKFRVKIQLTGSAATYYLKRNSSFNAGTIVNGAMSWETGSANRYEFWVGPHSIDNATYSNQVALVTLPLPVSGDVSVNVEYFEAATMGGPLGPSGSRTINYATSNAYLEAYVDGVIENQYNYSIYTASNTNAGNSLENTTDVLLGSGPTLNAYGALEAFNGTAWVAPTGWGSFRDGTYTLPHGQFLAQERLRLQNRVIKRFTGSIYGEYLPWWILERQGDRFILQGARHNVATETWTGTWVQIRYTSPGITNNPEETGVSNPGFGDDVDAPPGLQTGDTGLSGMIGSLQAESAGQVQTPLPAVPVLVTNAIPNTSTAIISSGATINTISANLPTTPYSYLIGDAITLVDAVSGLSQEFTMEANQHDSTTSLDVASGTAVGRFESGSFIQMQGDHLLGLLQWARRKVVRIQLLDKYSTIAAGVGSPTTGDYPPFWRPDNTLDTNEFKSTFWAARRINRMWLEIFNNPSNSTSLTYTFQVFKNGTQIHAENFNGTAKFVLFKLPDAEQLIPTTQTVYEFKCAGLRPNTGIALSAGLVVCIEVI